MRDADDDTPLFRAAAIGDNDEVERLIDEGVDVDELEESGQTPLMAASGIHIDTAGLLIGLGAEVNAVSDRGWTPIMLAYHRKDPEAVALLLSHSADTRIPDDTVTLTETDLCAQAVEDQRQEMVTLLCSSD